MKIQRKTWLRLSLVVLLLGTLGIGLLTQWRFQAVVLKLRGDLPTFTWHQVVYQFTGGDHRTVRAHQRGRLAWAKQEIEDDLCSILWVTPFGELWGNAPDQAALELSAREQWIEQSYHNSTVQIAAGDIVVDVGGHLGTFTRFALDHGAGKVVVLEPEPRNIACFRRTFAPELADGSVVLIEAAAWHQAGVLHFQGDGLVGHVDEQGQIEVRAVTIDDVAEELALERVDFIKMDIEGAELDALRGARRTLARFGPKMAISIYHRSEHPQEIPSFVASARPGYRLKTNLEFAYFH